MSLASFTCLVTGDLVFGHAGTFGKARRTQNTHQRRARRPVTDERDRRAGQGSLTEDTERGRDAPISQRLAGGETRILSTRAAAERWCGHGRCHYTRSVSVKRRNYNRPSISVKLGKDGKGRRFGIDITATLRTISDLNQGQFHAPGDCSTGSVKFARCSSRISGRGVAFPRPAAPPPAREKGDNSPPRPQAGFLPDTEIWDGQVLPLRLSTSWPP